MFSNNGSLSKRQTRHMASVQFFAVGGIVLMLQYNRIGWQLFAILLAVSIGYGYILPAEPRWSRSFRWLKIPLLCLLPAIIMLGIYTFLVQKQLLPERSLFWLLAPMAVLCLFAGRQKPEARGRLFEMMYLYIWLLFLICTMLFLGGWKDRPVICNTLFQLAMICGVFSFVSQCLHRWMQLGGKSDEA